MFIGRELGVGPRVEIINSYITFKIVNYFRSLTLSFLEENFVLPAGLWANNVY